MLQLAVTEWCHDEGWVKIFKDKSVILTSLKNTPYYESCKDSSEDICVTYKSNVTERGIPKELRLVHGQCERKSDVTVLYSWSVDGFLLRVLALSSSANFRICNLLYTCAKVCFHWFDQSVEQKLICVFFLLRYFKNEFDITSTFYIYVLNFAIFYFRETKAMNSPRGYHSMPFFKGDKVLISKLFAILVSCSVSN